MGPSTGDGSDGVSGRLLSEHFDVCEGRDDFPVYAARDILMGSLLRVVSDHALSMKQGLPVASDPQKTTPLPYIRDVEAHRHGEMQLLTEVGYDTAGLNRPLSSTHSHVDDELPLGFIVAICAAMLEAEAMVEAGRGEELLDIVYIGQELRGDAKQHFVHFLAHFTTGGSPVFYELCSRTHDCYCVPLAQSRTSTAASAAGERQLSIMDSASPIALSTFFPHRRRW